MGVYVYTPPRAALRGWGSIGTPCVATPRESMNRPHTTDWCEREEGEEREEGRKRKEGRGGGEKWGLKYGGGREVYAARACAGKYTPAPRLNALLMRSGLCPLRIGNER